MLPLEPLRAVRTVSITSPRTEDTGPCTAPDVVASGWSRQTPSACRNAGRIQQVHGGEGQACSGPLDGGNAAPPMSVSKKTFVFIAGRYAALRALHRSMLKRVSLVAAPRREVHVYGFGDGTRSPGGVGRSAIKGMRAALWVVGRSCRTRAVAPRLITRPQRRRPTPQMIVENAQAQANQRSGNAGRVPSRCCQAAVPRVGPGQALP